MSGTLPLSPDPDATETRLVWAEALRANGDELGSRHAIAAARAALFAFADRITDPVLRSAALLTIPEHARTLTLAREWIGAP